MLYQCSKCNKQFLHTAKIVTVGLPKDQLETLDMMLTEAPKDKDLDPLTDLLKSLRSTFDLALMEYSACPFCRSKEYTEFIEPTPTPEEISNVYIYDLSSGPQQALDMLLAQGYKIQQRYAKQYFLEKPKVASAKDYIVEAQEKAKEAQQP
jgi:hypothetical protein